MAAIFYQYGNNSIFKNSVGTGALLFCADLDDFSASSSNMSVVTDIGIHVQETVQFFQSFDDFIHYYYFGKGLGSITINMLFFQDCTSGTAPGLAKILQRIGEKRGKTLDVSIGNVVFTGVLMDFSITVMSEPETHYAISLHLGMTDHKMQAPSIDPTTC